MSLILDALNRSRQESDPVPGLTTHHPMEQVSSGKRQLLPWIVLVVALALIAWLLLERGSAPPPAPSASGIAAPVAELSKNIGSAVSAVKSQLKSRVETERNEQAVARAVPVTAAAKPSVTTVNDVEDVEDEAVAQLYQQREAVTPVAGEASAPAARSATPDVLPTAVTPSTPSQARQERMPISATTLAKTPAPVAQRDEQQVDIEKMLEHARDEMENTGLVEHPAPFIISLSQNTKNSIPTLLYQRHDYSNNAGRSSVVLNGKTLRVGGSPAAGVKVDEILPDSVVLSYRGTQFRLRALNSWVNL